MLEDGGRSPRATVIAALLCGGGPPRGPPRVAGEGWGERNCVPHQGHCPQRHKKSVHARRGRLQTLQVTRHAPAGPWGLVCSDSCAPPRDRAGRGQGGLWRQCAPSLAHREHPHQPNVPGARSLHAPSFVRDERYGPREEAIELLAHTEMSLAHTASKRRVSGGQVHARMLQILRSLGQGPGLTARERGWACSNRAIIQMGKAQGWQGRWGARGAGRQKAAPPAGARGAAKFRGR